MSIREAILNILELAKVPMTASELESSINNDNLFNKKITAIDITKVIKKNSIDFHEINGKVILSSNTKWNELLTVYTYISNILRGTYSITDLQFLIASLFYYKWNYDYENERSIKNSMPSINNENINWFFDELISYESLHSIPLNIYSDLTNLLRKISQEKVWEILSMLKRIDTSAFTQKEYSIAFDYILEVNLSGNFKSLLVRTPALIADLMIGILNPEFGSVYDPVCGTGGLLNRIKRDYSNNSIIKGAEINYRVAQLAYMNLNLLRSNLSSILAQDCFSEFSNNEKFDYIIGDLPLTGISKSTDIHEIEYTYGINLKKSKGFGAILLFILSKLNNKGKAVLIVSDSFLSIGGTEETVRNYLITNDLVESVVSLPDESLRPYTRGKASILVLNKSKPSYLIEKIKFLNIDNIGRSSQTISFNLKSILNNYREKVTEGKNVQVVELQDVLNTNSLQVNNYFSGFREADKLLREGRAVRLTELVEIRSGKNLIEKENLNSIEGVPYVKIENLEKDILSIYLSTESLENYIDNPEGYARSLVNHEVILVARIGDHLKPTYFKPSQNVSKIITHSGVFILEPKNNDDFILEYLYYLLYTPMVQDQVDIKRGGSVMPCINIKSLKSIIIPLMTLNAQREFVETQKANIIATEKAKVNQKLKVIGYEEEQKEKETDIVRTLVHELRPKLMKINSLSDKIKRIISKHSLGPLKEYEEQDLEVDPELIDIVENPENFSFKEISDILSTKANQLSNILTTVKNVMSFSLKPEDFEEVELTEFLQTYCASKKSEINDKYDLEIKGRPLNIEIHKASFKLIVDQLITNAENHGFVNDSSHYKIIFNIKKDIERSIAIIDYSNNGEKFLLSEKDYKSAFTKSKKSNGSGIGGNYIYRITKAHNGDMSINEKFKGGFKMTFEIPLKQNKS